jgi:hypothetical protein
MHPAKTGGCEQPGHLQRFGKGLGAIVYRGQNVAMPVNHQAKLPVNTVLIKHSFFIKSMAQ